MTPNYEPPAEMVEAEAERLEFCFRRGDSAESMARFVLRRQHEREAAAKLALRYLAELGGGNSEGNIYARRALERWDQLDAPKVPTLLEAATAYVQSRHNTDDSNGKARAALIAAVEREERKG